MTSPVPGSSNSWPTQSRGSGVGEAASGREAVERWRAFRPDVVLMDLHMPDGGGLEAIATIRAEDADAAIVAVTAFADEGSVAGALRAGATGYLGKEASPDEFARTIRAASRGEMVSRAAAERLHAHLNGRGDLASLTDREREVFGLLEGGSTDGRSQRR